MKKIVKTFLLFLCWSLVPGVLMARDCHACKAGNIANLQMNCPDCGANLHDPTLAYNALKKASLKVKLYYTGGKPERMPPYGKVFINGDYVGNIPMIEKEVVSKDFSQVWSDGFGRDYSAYYEKDLKDIPSGILKIEVEMRFDRFFGLARSIKRVAFPYVSFKPGENTVVSHRFNAPTSFHLYKPEPKKPIPIVSEIKLQGADGNVAVNIPLFK